jgi:hypothetical protein
MGKIKLKGKAWKSKLEEEMGKRKMKAKEIERNRMGRC